MPGKEWRCRSGAAAPPGRRWRRSRPCPQGRVGDVLTVRYTFYVHMMVARVGVGWERTPPSGTGAAAPPARQRRRRSRRKARTSKSRRG